MMKNIRGVCPNCEATMYDIWYPEVRKWLSDHHGEPGFENLCIWELGQRIKALETGRRLAAEGSIVGPHET